MANSDKDILITPNTGSSSADPKIEYVGADSSGNDTITVETLYDGTKATLSFEGSAGQLFSIVNDLTSNPIFSVNDVSGIPSIEVDSDGEIRLAEFSGNVGIGISTPTELLHVDGRIKANNLTLASLSAQNSEATAVMIDGSGIIGTRELGSNAFNSTAFLTGNQTITLSGDVSGSGTTSIAVTIADDSHNHIISNVDGLQTALDGKLALTGGTLTGSTRLQNDLNYFGIATTANEAEIVVNTGNAGSPQIGFTEHSDASWAIGIDDGDNSFKIHGTATATIPTINNLAVPLFEIATSAGVAYLNNQRIFNDAYHPNADKWTTARTITLGGDLTGNVSIDGSANVTLTAAVVDDSHNHVISNVDGLQTALDAKAPLASPTFTGNVGIGTTSPAEILELDKASGDTFIRFDKSGTFKGLVGIADSSASGSSAAVQGDAILRGQTNLLLDTGGTTRVKIDSSGNVGIGTTSPTTKLEVRNDVAATTDLDTTAIKLYNNSDGGSAIEFSNSVGGKSKISLGVEATGAGTDDTYLGFSTASNTGSLIERMRIDSSGNVGIGALSPDFKLEVNDAVKFDGQIRASTGSASAPAYTFHADNTLGMFRNPNVLGFAVAGEERMRIDSSGRITVATSANISQVAITSSSNAVAWNAAAAANAYHLTTQNTTFSAPTNAVEGAIISVEIAQGGTPYTVAWNTIFEFAASTAPTVTATANKTDIFSFRYNGSVWQEIGRVQNLAQT